MGSPSLHESLINWATVRPAAPCLIEIESGRTLSYGATLAAVRGLQGWLGCPPRTIVLALPGSIATAVVWLAALTGGHRLVPCSPAATDDERRLLAAKYQPDLWLGAPPEGGRISSVNQSELLHDGVWLGAPPAGGRIGGRSSPMVLSREQTETAIATWADEPGLRTARAAAFSPREGELCLTTSGTTGTPKGVRLRAGQIAWTAEQIRLSHGLTVEDRGLSVLPFFHVNAPVVSLCATVRAGGAVAIAERFSRSRFWDWIERERITWASLVPTIVALLLQDDRPGWLPGRLRFIRSASAPLPVVQLRAFEERFGIPLVETYGLSEAASQVAANPVPPGRRKPGSVGLPTGVSLRICEPVAAGEAGELVDVGPGAEGEICIAGPSVIDGYADGAGAESFHDGWFRTGDLGRRDDEGYLYITGRIRDVINRGGEKIAPREIEEVLLAHPAVRDVAVVGRPDPIYGQQAVAYVVARQPGSPGLAAELQAYSARRLTPYKVPAAFIEVGELPRSDTGKIQHQRVAGAAGGAAGATA